MGKQSSILTQADVSQIAACVQACDLQDPALIAKLRALYVLCGRQGVVLPKIKTRTEPKAEEPL